jgi:hypothetical protein
VGQAVGRGDLRLEVTGFRRVAERLDVTVSVTNTSGTPSTFDGAGAFTVFYGTGRHAVQQAQPSVATIAPGGSASFALLIRVPVRYRYPLLWIERPDITATTIVLRGANR